MEEIKKRRFAQMSKVLGETHNTYREKNIKLILQQSTSLCIVPIQPPRSQVGVGAF